MAVEYIGKGGFAAAADQNTLTVTVPGSYSSGDLLLLCIESENVGVSTPSGWTQAPSSPKYRGSAYSAGGVRITVFYKFAGASEPSVELSASGHYTGIMFAFRGVDTETPINASAGRTSDGAIQEVTCPGVTTDVDGCLIAHAIGLDRDQSLSDIDGDYSNPNLSDVTRHHDQMVSTGAGGGICFVTGQQSSAGATGDTTATALYYNYRVHITLALAPGAPPASASTTYHRKNRKLLANCV